MLLGSNNWTAIARRVGVGKSTMRVKLMRILSSSSFALSSKNNEKGSLDTSLVTTNTTTATTTTLTATTIKLELENER